jgi:Asp-tRNA(Asn)/Glu-tRNA(Gln) amidotransferase B subunit
MLRLCCRKFIFRYLPDADLPPILLDEEFIRAARKELPRDVNYLRTTLMQPPNNLQLDMTLHLSRFPKLLSYYNAVMKSSEDFDGPTVYNWYIHPEVH